MKNLILFFFIAVSTVAFAQENKGITFVHGMRWAKILEQAKAENKYIFLDAYTTWCGPCKYMSQNIFPQPEVGTFFNKNYINVKIQMNVTKADNEDVKSLYTDAKEIESKYGIKAYPTYLFFSPDGELVHRELGSFPAEEFITKAKNALDPSKQYYTLKKIYDAGDKSDGLLRALVNGAMAAADKENLPTYSTAYIATQNDLLTEPNIRILASSIQSSKDTGFKLLLSKKTVFDIVLGAEQADNIIR